MEEIEELSDTQQTYILQFNIICSVNSIKIISIDVLIAFKRIFLCHQLSQSKE
jgi:hypothetical protein